MLCDVFDVVVVICCVKLFDLLVFGNVGSFFKNLVIDVVQFDVLCVCVLEVVLYLQLDGYVKFVVGWLIDCCGWKGCVFGVVVVYDCQVFVFVNCGGVIGVDVLVLVWVIQVDVCVQFGVELEVELVCL